jgi:hypothetical protein
LLEPVTPLADEDKALTIQVRAAPVLAESGANRMLRNGRSLRSYDDLLAGNAAVAERWKAARRLVESYVEHYNNVRLNSAIGYITPNDVLGGRQQEIHAERDHKLEAARQQRQSHRQQAA